MASRHQPSARNYNKMPPPRPAGSACGGCTVPSEGREEEHALLFVGASCGCYPKRETYEYDGEGAGDSQRRRCIMCCVLAFASLLLIAVFLKGKFASDHGYDCDADFSHWQEVWSRPKKEWCCREHGRGCNGLFDCSDGFDNWEAGWSADKKEWCCSNANRGCPLSTTSPVFDCVAGLSNSAAGWSESKKSWCCHNTGRGCTTMSTTSPPYDCVAGVNTWQSSWSDAKKVWCCQNHGRGCQVAE